MTMAAISDPKANTEPATKPRFETPGPGSWVLDSSHCQRPRSAWINALCEKVYAEGFRRGFARYGALLDTIEYRSVNGYPYTSIRPLGAPPDAKGAPPKWIFKLLVAIVPALRQRCARAKTVLETRLWREDIETFWRDLAAEESRLAAHIAEPIASYDDAALLDHLVRVHATAESRFLSHFAASSSSMVPVGDFVVHVREWTGASTQEVLQTLRGCSPASVAGALAMEELAAAVTSDADAAKKCESGEAASVIVDALLAWPGVVGEKARALLERYGDAVMTGHDVSELRLREMPDVVLATMKAHRQKAARADDAKAQANAIAAKLRERVPEAHRAFFDELLAEARTAYPVRDARSTMTLWTFGMIRRALLEAGARLARTKRIERVDDVFDLDQDELVAVLRGAATPTAGEIATRARWRRTGRVDDAPAFLGNPPASPPPADWLPEGAARTARAIGIYIDGMFGEGEGASKRDGAIRGFGASPGRRTGRARLVRSAADFGKLRQGDILVATITTPAYNVILPLLGGVVTDRGGLLSHPAIVSREYGFPGVVGAKVATSKIPDGALVEIDGDAGTVKVLE